MRESQWIEWTRTRLHPQEREALLAALTSDQKAHLLDRDYVWVEGVGVLWKPADGALRRTRFTHGAHFQTQRGEFYVDSEGHARQLADRRIAPATPAVRPPGRPRNGERCDDLEGGGSLDTAVPRLHTG